MNTFDKVSLFICALLVVAAVGFISVMAYSFYEYYTPERDKFERKCR